MRKFFRKRNLVIAGLALAGLTAGLLVAGAVTGKSWQPLASLSGKSKTLALMGTLEGFEPGAKVSYSIMPDEGRPAHGEAKVDAAGKLDIPAYNLFNAAGRNLSYAIEVNEKEKPLNLAFTFDAKEGKIAVQGRGLDPSAEISLGGEKTRTDWAGLIRENIAGDLNQLGREEGFKVAMLGNVASDADNRARDKIIKVLAAPGGGLYEDPLLNVYVFPYGCNDGQGGAVMYSFCIPGSMMTPLIVHNYVKALMLMTEQLTAVMASMMLHVGAMIDAKFQLETQREMQRLVAQAHKDYHPSEMMCEYGSFMRSIYSSEEKSMTEKMTMSSLLTQFYVGTAHNSSSESFTSDFNSRGQQFRTVYCDTNDNNNGLNFMCDHDQVFNAGAAGSTNPGDINKDIDFRRTIDQKLTVNIDFTSTHTGGVPVRPPEPDEPEVLALAKNLYWPRPLPPGVPETINDDFFKYINARHIYAAMNVAHNSYVTIAGMKSKSHPTMGPRSGWAYMQAMMRNFGMDEQTIYGWMDQHPSYYAQMEILTKKIYQHPDFYTNLYDKPANVKRIGVTLEAIKLMQQQDFYDSMLRREMMTSLLLEEALQPEVQRLNAAVVQDARNLQRR
ncbi:MAG: hypothetical protein DYH13_03015 [Alphaproteobacteria bacterium PRO2]|nr:hypothetical protein [Alphaproteobacteria bacterium PRO2]